MMSKDTIFEARDTNALLWIARFHYWPRSMDTATLAPPEGYEWAIAGKIVKHVVLKGTTDKTLPVLNESVWRVMRTGFLAARRVLNGNAQVSYPLLGLKPANLDYSGCPYMGTDFNLYNSTPYGLSTHEDIWDCRLDWHRDNKLCKDATHSALGSDSQDHEHHIKTGCARYGEHSHTLDPEAPEPPANDNVNHPGHYASILPGLEAIEVIKRSLTPEQFAGYCMGSYLKYRFRAGHKPGSSAHEDIGKSNKYADFLKNAQQESENE